MLHYPEIINMYDIEKSLGKGIINMYDIEEMWQCLPHPTSSMSRKFKTSPVTNNS